MTPPPFPRTEVLRDGSALAPGSRLQEYEVEALVGEGGFSIVYRVRDTLLGRTVALKEYLPTALARRDADQRVVPRSARQEETFRLGLRSFVNEAQLLASFDHPSLVKVYRFWEGNGTAYMVMPLYEGQTLLEWMRARNAPADEAWLRRLLAPLLDALELMHGNRCYHRDIAPDNLLLIDPAKSSAGSTHAYADAPHPVLLDFGAARRVIGDATQALTAILKPGFAPIEQYSESKQSRQGPWTDLYALCALLYYAVTGKAPMASVSRLVHDELVPASIAARGRCSDTFLRAIDLGMAVRPQDRPQSVDALRALFAGARPPDTTVLPTLPIQAQVDWPAAPPPGDEARTVVLERPDDTAPPAQRRTGVVAAAIAAVAAVGIGAWLLTRPSPAPPPATAKAPASTPAPPPAAPDPAPPTAAAPPPFSVLAALNDVVQGADPAIQVDARADKPTLVIGRDPLRLRVRSSQPGFVYVLTGGTEKSHFYLLFPNRIDGQNRIEANQDLTLPRASWNLTAGGPPGTNQIVVMVSRSPRDLGASGIKSVGQDIPEFDLGEAARRWSARAAGAPSPFIGVADCKGTAGGAACPEGYGARLLEVEEVARP